MKTRALYALEADQRLILDSIGEDGELDQRLEDFFATVQDEEAVKLDGYCNVLRTLEMEENQAKQEAKMYADMARQRSNAQERLKDRLKQYLEATGRTEALTATKRKVKIVGNGGHRPLTCYLMDEGDALESLPSDLIEVVRKPNKDKIREFLEAGLPVPYYTLGERGTHVRIS